MQPLRTTLIEIMNPIYSSIRNKAIHCHPTLRAALNQHRHEREEYVPALEFGNHLHIRHHHTADWNWNYDEAMKERGMKKNRMISN